MPSIFERLRKRTLSSHSAVYAHSATLPPVTPRVAPLKLSPSRSEPMLVDRRIVEDLPALLGSLQTDVTPGLKPPRARKRSGLRSLGLEIANTTTPPVQAPSSEKENEDFYPTTQPIIPAPSAWKGKQRASQQFTSSPWSTFGRHRPGRSPYGTSHPPSARSSRMASGDSGANRGSPLGHGAEGNTMSNLASTASVDHKSNSRPTDSSRNVSVLSVLAGSLSNYSSRSSRSGAVTFGRRSPSNEDRGTRPPTSAGTLTAYTSMPTLPSSYSNEDVLIRGNTFPRTNERGHRLSQSRNDALHLAFAEMIVQTKLHDTLSITEGDISVSGGNLLNVDAQGHQSAAAEPHTKHASDEETSARPCSPSRLIPRSLSSSTSQTLLHAPNCSDDVRDNLSHFTSEDKDWMAAPGENAIAKATLTPRTGDTRDPLRRGSSLAAHKATPSRARSRRLSQLSEQSSSSSHPIASNSYSSSSFSKQNGGAGPSTAAFPTFASTPPPPSPKRLPRTPRTASEPMLRSVSEKSYDQPQFETPTNQKGKRKADQVDVTPPDQRAAGPHATFVIPTDGRRSHHVSEVSKPPSSYQGRKRARLSTSGASPSASPGPSRPGSVHRQLTDSWPSRHGVPAPLDRAMSKTASMRSARPESMGTNTNAHRQSYVDRRRSMSEISFPISALVAPHAPSMSVRSGGYYMRDPRKPPKIQPTPWSLHLNSAEEQGSPIHGWMFFIGFVLFPLWWLASFWRIPQTRRVGGTDTEKAVTLDDPQVEHDARSWRFRCRVMAVVSFFTYIPFIVLVAVFVPRN